MKRLNFVGVAVYAIYIICCLYMGGNQDIPQKAKFVYVLSSISVMAFCLIYLYSNGLILDCN